jgi:hypothetical protein
LHYLVLGDPELERTILINSKFDNRVKEFSSAEMALEYLAGEDLPASAIPFFISLPVQRNLSPQAMQDEIKRCHLKDYKKLLKLGLQPEHFAQRLGFVRVRQYVVATVFANVFLLPLPRHLVLYSWCFACVPADIRVPFFFILSSSFFFFPISHLESALREQYAAAAFPALQALKKLCEGATHRIITLEVCDVGMLKILLSFFVVSVANGCVSSSSSTLITTLSADALGTT